MRSQNCRHSCANYEQDLERWTARRRRYPMSRNMPKERPRCRRVIIEHQLTPYPSVAAWDGCSAFDRGRRTFLSDGLKVQMRRMIVEGYWGRCCTEGT